MTSFEEINACTLNWDETSAFSHTDAERIRFTSTNPLENHPLAKEETKTKLICLKKNSMATPWVNTGAINAFLKAFAYRNHLSLVRNQKTLPKDGVKSLILWNKPWKPLKMVWWPTKSGSTEGILRTTKKARSTTSCVMKTPNLPPGDARLLSTIIPRQLRVTSPTDSDSSWGYQIQRGNHNQNTT